MNKNSNQKEKKNTEITIYPDTIKRGAKRFKETITSRRSLYFVGIPPVNPDSTGVESASLAPNLDPRGAEKFAKALWRCCGAPSAQTANNFTRLVRVQFSERRNVATSYGHSPLAWIWISLRFDRSISSPVLARDTPDRPSSLPIERRQNITLTVRLSSFR